MFSKACEYGIRAVIYIAGQSVNGHRASLKGIAAEIDSPEAFTAKILQQLVRHNILTSVKGPGGGFEMDPARMEKIKLSEVVLALDGDGIFNTCGLGLKVCSEKQPCPVHHQFKHIRDGLKNMVENTSMLDLCSKLHAGHVHLKQ